jgi:hypothetical protein
VFYYIAVFRGRQVHRIRGFAGSLAKPWKLISNIYNELARYKVYLTWGKWKKYPSKIIILGDFLRKIAVNSPLKDVADKRTEGVSSRKHFH